MIDAFNRLQGARTALPIKTPVRAASTGNLTLSGFQTIDGVTFASGDKGNGLNMRVLVKDQTDGEENGIYEVQSGEWARAKDFNGNTDFLRGTLIRVTQGTVNSREFYEVTSTDPPNIGIDTIEFSKV